MNRHIDQRTEELTTLQESDKDHTIKDVFGRLVNARVTEGKNALSEQEIIANCFAFVSALLRQFIQSSRALNIAGSQMFAGHGEIILA